jgi:hypothetical protein
MSVPLDRLYHYLADVVNHDLVIYRWSPHGSKKIEDLVPLKNYSKSAWPNFPQMICHDQEPLAYDLYSDPQIRIEILRFFSRDNLESLATDSAIEHCAKLHWRGLLYVFNQFDKTLLLHSEQNSSEVNKFEQSGFVPVYYWSHAVIALDWFRYAEHDPELAFDPLKIQQDFLIYNRAWAGTREYRLCFVEQLLAHGLKPYCNISFNPTDGKHYNTHQFVNPNFQIINYNLHDELPLNTHASTASADYCSEDYATTGIEVVLETLFDDSRWHLTEKTLRPIACGRPFLLMSTAGSLAYLRQYGFETFSGLIDESYDQITNPRQRLQAVIAEMSRISSLPAAAKAELFLKLHNIADQNQQHFFNNLFEQVQTEYLNNMQNAMMVMNQHCTDQHRRELKTQSSSDYTALSTMYDVGLTCSNS